MGWWVAAFEIVVTEAIVTALQAATILRKRQRHTKESPRD